MAPCETQVRLCREQATGSFFSPRESIARYVLGKIEPSERWLMPFMKFIYGNFRAQRIDRTTAAIHCRFDDPCN